MHVQESLHRGLCVCTRARSCPALCDPMDCCPPGSSVRGILQARMLEWAVISSSRGSSLSRDQTCISCDCCIDRQIIPEPLEKPSINKTQSITPEHRSQARVANILFCCLQTWFLNLTHLLFV